MSSPASARDKVTRIAPNDPRRALDLARAIDDPWYRCQALAVAALHHTDPSIRERVIDEAFGVALTCGDPNRVVTVSSWPMKVLATHNRVDRVAKEADRLLDLIGIEPSPVRRADALNYLFGAVIRARGEVTTRVIEAFVAACLQSLRSGGRKRKGESLLASCLPAITRIDERMGAQALARLPEARAEAVRGLMMSTQFTPLDQLAPWPNLGDQP